MNIKILKVYYNWLQTKMKTCGEEPMNYGGSEKNKRKTGRKNRNKKQGKAEGIIAVFGCLPPFFGSQLGFGALP